MPAGHRAWFPIMLVFIIVIVIINHLEGSRTVIMGRRFVSPGTGAGAGVIFVCHTRMPSVLATWPSSWAAHTRWQLPLSTPEARERLARRTSILHNTIMVVTCRHFRRVLLVRNKSQVPPTLKGRGSHTRG